MTYTEVLELLHSAAAGDLSISERHGDIYVTEEDFGGFDSHWREIERELADQELVESIYEAIEEAALSIEGDYYTYFQFEGFTVVWGYASMDV